jgi:hypothetical protein
MWQTGVPCDMCVNAILVASVVVGNLPLGSLKIYHCSTSQSVKFEFHTYVKDAANYLKYNPFDSSISEDIGFRPAYSMEEWNRYRFLKYDVPSKAMLLASKIPFIDG